MPKFENDEVAILQNLIPEWSQYNGEEVVIIKCIGLSEWKDSTSGKPVNLISYLISAPFINIRKPVICESSLRKKKPPEEEINWVEKLGLDKIKHLEKI